MASLEARYGYRAAWTETIAFEVRRGLPHAPHLRQVLAAQWLGEPVGIELTPAEQREVGLIRRALGGGASKPLQHLGEAEII